MSFGSHVSPELMSAYCARDLPEVQEMAIEAHLGGCEACSALARRARAYTQVWNGWTVEAHGSAYADAKSAAPEASLAEALQTACENPAYVRFADRVAAWRERVLSFVAESRLLPGEVRERARKSAADFDEYIAEFREALPQALSELLGIPAIAGARVGGVLTLGPKVRTRGGSHVRSRGPAVARVGRLRYSMQTLPGRKKGIVLRVAGLTPTKRPGRPDTRLALFIPVRPGLELRLAEMEWLERERQFRVELPGIDPKDYLVAVEQSEAIPAAAKRTRQ